eukprot:4697707-Amphidinium_carterae.1
MKGAVVGLTGHKQKDVWQRNLCRAMKEDTANGVKLRAMLIPATVPAPISNKQHIRSSAHKDGYEDNTSMPLRERAIVIACITAQHACTLQC